MLAVHSSIAQRSVTQLEERDRMPIVPIIELDSDTVQTGEMLSGRVLLGTTDPLKAHYLKLTLEGKETIKKFPTDNVSKILNTVFVQWNAYDIQPGLIDNLQRGFSFSYRLPQDLSPTFNYDKGSIKYFLRLAYHFPGCGPRESKVKVVVKQICSLMRNPFTQYSRVINHEDRNIELKATISDAFLYPGAQFTVTAEVKNVSGHTVWKLGCQLTHHTQHHKCANRSCVQLPYASQRCDIKERKVLSDFGVTPFKLRYLETRVMEIPMTVPVNTSPSFFSKTIQMSHLLQLKIYRDKFIQTCNPALFLIAVEVFGGPPKEISRSDLLNNFTDFGFHDEARTDGCGIEDLIAIT